MTMMMMIIINLIYIAQLDTNGILTSLYIVITYTQPHYMHLCMAMHEHSYSYTYTDLNIYAYANPCNKQQQQ